MKQGSLSMTGYFDKGKKTKREPPTRHARQAPRRDDAGISGARPTVAVSGDPERQARAPCAHGPGCNG
jgi:hypothetical protein